MRVADLAGPLDVRRQHEQLADGVDQQEGGAEAGEDAADPEPGSSGRSDAALGLRSPSEVVGVSTFSMAILRFEVVRGRPSAGSC